MLPGKLSEVYVTNRTIFLEKSEAETLLEKIFNYNDVSIACEIAADLEKLGCQAGNFAAFARFKGDMAEATLARECLNQNCECVVAFAHIRGVDLTRVASENDLGAVADAGQDCLERRWFEVLGLVDHDDLGLQAATAQESDRFES